MIAFGVGSRCSFPSPAGLGSWSLPALVLNDNRVTLDVVLVLLMNGFVVWDDLVFISDVWVNLVLSLVVGVDNRLQDMGDMQVMFVEVVLMDLMSVEEMLMDVMNVQVVLVDVIPVDDFLVLIVFVNFVLMMVMFQNLVLMKVVVVDLVNMAVMLNYFWRCPSLLNPTSPATSITA
jgi:hypothetical protein